VKIRLKNIVIGRDLCGMQIALLKDATFIPISFLPSFGWETTNYNNPIINFNRTFKKGRKIPELYIVKTKHSNKNIDCFNWELEYIYRYILQLSDRLYDSDSLIGAKIYSDNCITLLSKYGNSVEIEFDTCHVLNPDYTWFEYIQDPLENISSEYAHIIYYLILSKDTDDMKGISYEYDIEELNNEYFSKIWYSPLFGPKRCLIGRDVKRKKATLTTRHICLFIENVSISEIEEEKYSVAEARKEIYKLLGTRHKRISDRILSFDKSICKINLQTNLDMYKDTDNVKFIYYTNKEEILCQKNLNFSDWPQSSPRTLMYQLQEIITST